MKKFLARDSRLLVDCAMGRKSADLVIQNGRWVCVQTGEIIEHTSVAIIDGRIAFVGPDAQHTIGPATKIIDANGKYLVPGLLDGHMHVESGMLTVTEFVRAVLPHGTTTMFIDPHEIANIFGLAGVKLMVDEATLQPNHIFVQVPSCVPSAPGLETPGASIGPEEVAEAMQWEGIIGLGEMMNFPGVANSDEKMHAEMEIAHSARKVIGGHYASPDLGLPFSGYVAGGPQDDHEGTRVEDAIARARQGMKVMMRYGSAWHDVVTQIKAITDFGLSPRNFLLCTDDSHSATLISEGHMDRVLRHTIAQGIDPMLAIQMATINTAEYFRLDGDIGQIAPGRYADILLVENLSDFKVDTVIAQGKIVAGQGKLFIDLPEIAYPEWVTNSVKIKTPVNPDRFRVETDKEGTVTVNVIGVIENQAPTRHLKMKLPASLGKVHLDSAKDVAHLAVMERHHGTGNIQNGFVSGFGFQGNCAIATTVAHDSHQLIVAGTSEEDMALAVNRVIEIEGGQVFVKDGKVIGEVQLPIAGIMSNRTAEEVSKQAFTVLDAFQKCGCMLNNPNMQLSLLGLVVIPELRLSDLGLVDVTQFKFIPVIQES
ncbi:MAG: adenine deaminase [Chloroflexi bacterium HGW-Chloroflexi-10]|nr:MAG: adenine deaminase [Chloroflexi bacterium HGW-Chloroflexi-10]